MMLIGSKWIFVGLEEMKTVLFIGIMNQETKDSYIKVALGIGSYCVFWMILMLIVTSIPWGDDLRFSPIVGAPAILFVFLCPGYVAYVIVTNYEKIKNYVIGISRNAVSKVQEIGNDGGKGEYLAAKHRFKYLSDGSLLAEYKERQKIALTDLETLALEEELVDRKLIEYSPLHEMLHQGKKRE